MLLRRQSGRRGAVLFIVLACAAATSSLLATSIRSAYLRQRFLASSQRVRQCQWLADSGVEQGLAALARNAGYVGETWRIDAANLDGRDDATVEIRIAGIGKERELTVAARFPAGPDGALAQRTLKIAP